MKLKNSIEIKNGDVDDTSIDDLLRELRMTDKCFEMNFNNAEAHKRFNRNMIDCSLQTLKLMGKKKMWKPEKYRRSRKV